MRLDLIVPHYKEPWETCKYLFDSIALQRGINMEDIKVIVVNDGDCLLDESNFQNYPFKVEYLVKEHGGVSAARNYGLDHSDADYIMFCDIDDGFLNNYGIHLVFGAMNEGFDLLVSNFVEEVKGENGMAIVNHDKDMTFMHGKAYRRQFLIDHDLRFDPAMTLHEDGYFNLLVYSVAKHEGKQKNVSSPFYLWRWNDNSTVRKDKDDFVLRTYKDVMLTRIGVCRQLKARGYMEDYESAVGITVLNSYYDFQKTSYHLAKNQKHLRVAEKAFQGFWLEFKPTFLDLTNKKIGEMAVAARANAYMNGMLLEREDLRTFLRHIESI